MHITNIQNLALTANKAQLYCINTCGHYYINRIDVTATYDLTIQGKTFHGLLVTDFYDKRERKILENVLLFPETVKVLNNAITKEDYFTTYSIYNGWYTRHSYTGQLTLEEMERYIYNFLKQFNK